MSFYVLHLLKCSFLTSILLQLQLSLKICQNKYKLHVWNFKNPVFFFLISNLLHTQKLTPVPVRVEVEEEREHAPVEHALVPLLLLFRPLLVEDFECEVLVGGTGVEAEDAELGGVRLLDEKLGGGGLVDEVGIEDAELVALDDLGRRVVVVVVGLVVLVPVPSGLDPVEVAGFARFVLAGPLLGLREGRGAKRSDE